MGRKAAMAGREAAQPSTPGIGGVGWGAGRVGHRGWVSARAEERAVCGEQDAEGGARAFQPDSVTASSETHVMVPPDGTTPAGPEVPQYLTPLTTR